jgi:hypothetical protein
MRPPKLTVSGLLVLGSVCAASGALAGYTGSSYVWIGSTNFGGQLSVARYSSDPNQYIGCYVDVSTIPYNSPLWVQCFAEDSTGKQASCWSTDPNMATQARSINATSYLDAYHDANAKCIDITVQNTSWGLH